MSGSPVTGAPGRASLPLSLRFPVSRSYQSFAETGVGVGVGVGPQDDPEFFSPAPLSASRHASLPSAIFSLVSTIIGGGVLSIPFAFKNTGILTGAIFLIIIAVASDFSIYILMSCSRRVEGGKTYEEVVQRAFGSSALLLTVTLLFCLIYLCCVAYLILIRDLICPIVELAIGHTLPHTYRVLVVLLVVLCILPLCFQRSLHALRFTSVTSFVSVIVLAITITYRTIQREWLLPSTSSDSSAGGDVGVGVGVGSVQWVPSSWHSAVYAFPIMSVAYLCHFNVLPIHGDLIRPTRTRIKSFVNWVIVVCTALYLEIGIMGYWYAREQTEGNILNNFRSDDVLISVGRVGLGFTCCCSFPLLVLPCRAVLHRILHLAALPTQGERGGGGGGALQSGGAGTATGTGTGEGAAYQPIATEDDDEERESEQDQDQEKEKNRNGRTDTSVGVGVVVGASGAESWFVSEPSLVMQTLVIVGSSFLLSTLVSSVAVMWSILGSTVSILIAYIIPAACYLKIRGGRGRGTGTGRTTNAKPPLVDADADAGCGADVGVLCGVLSLCCSNIRVASAWLLLLLGLGCLVLCSYQAAASLA